MRLLDVIASVPGARLATEADNEAILALFDRKPMGTARFEVAYRRSPDFFRLLRYQSERAFVFVSDDGEGGVRGVGTLSVRPAWVEGEPTHVGYLGDLRIAQDRRLLVHWRRAYGEVVGRARAIDELSDCEHFVTAVMDDNKLARAALVERTRGAGPRYLPLSPFRMRSVLGRKPFARRARPPFLVRPAVPADRDAIEAFYEERQRARLFGFRGDLRRRLEGGWEGFSIERFVIGEDRRGEIVACSAVWSPAAAKTTLVSRIPRELELAGALARALPGRPIVNVPRAGEPLRIGYMTCLELAPRLSPSERSETLAALIDETLRVERDAGWHMLALPEHRVFPLGDALSRFFVNDVPITLYSVHASGTERSPYALREPPAFEMALV